MGGISDPQAETVIKVSLYETGRALLSNDFDHFIQFFTMPFVSETFEGTKVFETVDAMRDAFDITVGYYRSHNVTTLERDVLAASFRHDKRVISTHQTRILSGSILVKPLHFTYSELTRENGEWKTAVTRYAMTDAPELQAALGGSGKPVRTTNTRPQGSTRDD